MCYLLLVLAILEENDWPVDKIETNEDTGKENLAGEVEPLPCQHLIGLEQHNLKDGNHVCAKQEQEAGDDPDVHVGDIGDLRESVLDGAVHSGEGEEGHHAQGNPCWNSFCRKEEHQVTQGNEDDGRKESLSKVEINLTN